MGTICSCNDLSNENYKEYNGFGNKPYNPKIRINNKRNYDEYLDKDKIFYEKTDEYDKYIKNKVQKGKKENEPKEYINGTVKVILI